MRLRDLKIEVDTHTHTVLSGHAWSTLEENCRAAVSAGLKGICITEHGPAMIGGVSWFFPSPMKGLPEEHLGIRLFRGMEYNILDRDGSLDIEGEKYLRAVEFGIASLHDVTMEVTNEKDHTNAYIAALQNPYVDILGHPGNPHFPHAPEPIVREAQKLGKLIEINNNSFGAREGSYETCTRFAQLCKEMDVLICVSSDSHFHPQIGQVPLALEMLEEVGFPIELILNRSYELFCGFLENRPYRKREKK